MLNSTGSPVFSDFKSEGADTAVWTNFVPQSLENVTKPIYSDSLSLLSM